MPVLLTFLTYILSAKAYIFIAGFQATRTGLFALDLFPDGGLFTFNPAQSAFTFFSGIMLFAHKSLGLV
jgi:hypothetical protein